MSAAQKKDPAYGRKQLSRPMRIVGNMFRKRKEFHLYKAFKSTYHEWTSKYEVEYLKEGIVVDKEEIIMMKEMENKEIL